MGEWGVWGFWKDDWCFFFFKQKTAYEMGGVWRRMRNSQRWRDNCSMGQAGPPVADVSDRGRATLSVVRCGFHDAERDGQFLPLCIPAAGRTRGSPEMGNSTRCLL